MPVGVPTRMHLRIPDGFKDVYVGAKRCVLLLIRMLMEAYKDLLLIIRISECL